MFPRKKIGLGPEPLINNIHHKKALTLYGIYAETFVNHVYYITNDFDVIIKQIYSYFYFIYWIFSYKAIFIYFNGGLLAFAPWNFLIKPLEPLLYKIAGIKIVVMPYGGDVQNFNIYSDVVYKSAYVSDYPVFIQDNYKKNTVEKNVKRWIKYADWIIAGCDWVNYLPYWNTLTLAHFSVDMHKWFPVNNTTSPVIFDKNRPIKILHAPNHKAIKGTDFIENTINKLKNENYPIEYLRIQKVPNDELVKTVQSADIIIDQMIIGWYGIFALEAAACQKPVLIYISPELERLYVMSGLLEVDELPFIKIDHNNLKKILTNIINNPTIIKESGEKSYKYVNTHHSCEYIGGIFKDILIRLGCSK
jgi:hypothetical protein